MREDRIVFALLMVALLLACGVLFFASADRRARSFADRMEMPLSPLVPRAEAAPPARATAPKPTAADKPLSPTSTKTHETRRPARVHIGQPFHAERTPEERDRAMTPKPKERVSLPKPEAPLVPSPKPSAETQGQAREVLDLAKRIEAVTEDMREQRAQGTQAAPRLEVAGERGERERPETEQSGEGK
jgi:hypothetical protein